MKLKSSVFSLLAAVVLLSSCEPRDQKITRPDTRANPNGGPAAQSNGEKENYKYVALLAERQVEAIELFRAVIDADFVNAQNIAVREVAPNRKEISFKNETAQAKRDLVLVVDLSFDENKQLNRIIAQAEVQMPFEKSNKAEISLQTKRKKIEMVRSADGVWLVELAQMDQINVKAGKSTMSNLLKFQFASVEGNPDLFKIQSIELQHVRDNGGPGSSFDMKSNEQTDLTIEMKAGEKCTNISGVLGLNSVEIKKDKSGPLYQRKLTYKNSNLIIEAGKDLIDLPAAVCEERLPVDISKIL